MPTAPLGQRYRKPFDPMPRDATPSSPTLDSPTAPGVTGAAEASGPSTAWLVEAAKTNGVVVAFVASGCPHCAAFHAAIERAGIVARYLPRSAAVMEVDATAIVPLRLREQVLALGINAYPTVVRLRVDAEGAMRVVKRFNGARTSSALLDFARGPAP